jgi:hypothetical protein
MGKQINYYMEYESFCTIAQTALEKGCIILKDFNDRIVQSKNISIVNKDCKRYNFYFPQAGELKLRTIETVTGGIREVIDRYSQNALIEASFSYIDTNRILSSRLYIQSGDYDENGKWIPRPECITKVYHSLVRAVKKVAPYREYTRIATNMNWENYLEEYESKYKEYITDYCAELKEKGYDLV